MDVKESAKRLVKRILIKKEHGRYHRLLESRKGSYEKWIAGRESSQSAAEGSYEEKERDFVLIVAAEGSLAENAVINIARYFKENPGSMIVYGDEDVREPAEDGRAGKKTVRSCPWFKPDWSPDLLDSSFYFGSLIAVRKSLFDRASAMADARQSAVDGIACYRVSDFTAYQCWIFECLRLIDAYQKGNRGRVGHVEKILFHSVSEAQQRIFRRDNELLRQRRGEKVRRFAERAAEAGEKPLLSVIIPSKDNSEMLGKCLRAVKAASVGMSVEVILIDNGSEPDEKKRVEKIIQELTCDKFPISYFYETMEFHFSKMCNQGAAAARGELLLFLNDDVELTEGSGLLEMAALAHREGTGAVGMKLRYPAVERIQHIGITNLPMGPVHKLQSLKDDTCYESGFNEGRRNFLAVTGACLMTGREKFREAGGFPEELRVAFNDVALCFRLYELGYHNVCVNSSFAYHFESFSRGDDEAADRLERLLEERRKLYERHPQLEGFDPYFPSGFCREGLDVRVRPAYETAGNREQRLSKVSRMNLRGCRQEKCLLVRAEDFRERRLVGWSVVLGDDNACYEKILLLMKNEEEIFGALAEESYRPDLQENMPDQKNVALSGFQIRFEEGTPPAGDYLVGMCARNRVTGLRLVNWSSRRISL